MKRILIEAAYDGTSYYGWQIQANGISVEEKLNQVLSDFFGEEIRVIGASRTDSGVHALGNVAVFDTNSTIPPDRICYALNTKLPDDIRIVSSREVPADFHPRYRKSVKTYEYRIQNVRIPFPTECRYTHLVTGPLDTEKMRTAAQYFVGTHDFKSFCASGTSVKTTVRTIRSFEVESFSYGREDTGSHDPANLSCRDENHKGVQSRRQEGKRIVLRIAGEGFLYNMVRIIAGTLIKVGLGVYPPEYVKEILQARNRDLAGDTAPAKGLFLKKIIFEED